MTEKKTYLMHWRVETDDIDRGEYTTIERALSNAKPEDYVIEVTYREISARVIKYPDPKVEPEIKKGDWLVLSGDSVKKFCIDLADLELSQEEEKDLLTYRAKICARYGDYLPFLDVDDIKTMAVQKKKFGARLVGDLDHTTEWSIFNNRNDATAFLLKTYKVKVTHD